jgi:hypothetical protein
MLPHPAPRLAVPFGTDVESTICELETDGTPREWLLVKALEKAIRGEAPLLTVPVRPFE